MQPAADAQVLAAAVSAALPEADRSAQPSVLDRGFGSVVLRIGDTIVRVARNEETLRGHELEARLLPALAGRLSAQVPDPVTLIPPSSALPFGASAHPAIPGRTMTPQDADTWPELSADIAHLLAGIHGTPAVRGTSAGVVPWLPNERLPALRDATAAVLSEQLSPQEQTGFATRWGAIGPILEARGPVPVLCHGDPWYENFLVDPTSGRLTGVLDFEDAVIADPALDLAAVFDLGDPFGYAVVSAYGVRRGQDPQLLERIRAHRLIRELSGLAYALRNDQPEEVPDVVAAIRALL